jgi:hypothetical protein
MDKENLTKADIEQMIKNLESYACDNDKIANVVRELAAINRALHPRLTVNAVLAYNDEKVNMVEWTRRVSSLLGSCQLLLGIGVFLLLSEVIHHW